MCCDSISAKLSAYISRWPFNNTGKMFTKVQKSACRDGIWSHLYFLLFSTTVSFIKIQIQKNTGLLPSYLVTHIGMIICILTS